MHALDYSSFFIYEQNELLAKSHSQFNWYSNWFFQIFNSTETINNRYRRLNSTLTTSQLAFKGFLTELKENSTILKGKDLRSMIDGIDSLILEGAKHASALREKINDDNENKYPELRITESILLERLDIMYDINRFLKKSNKFTPIETSNLAKSIAEHSANTLQKVVYGD